MTNIYTDEQRERIKKTMPTSGPTPYTAYGIYAQTRLTWTGTTPSGASTSLPPSRQVYTR